MKNLYMIACISKDLGLGNNGQLLWHIKDDMQFFRQTTSGHPVIMGSKTFQSIGRPLPKRENIVLSRRDVDSPDVKTFHSLPDLSQYLESIDDLKFIIGGASLYQAFLDQAETLYLTEVDSKLPADTYFPTFDPADFDRHLIQSGEQDGIKFKITEYTRR